jgi:hypothetical protein
MIAKVTFACAALLVLAAAAHAADVTGKWLYEIPGRGGGTPGITTTLNLKSDGDKLTGTVAMTTGAVEIRNGKVDGSNVSFEVKREVGGATMVTKYEGEVSGAEMKLKIIRDTQNGSRTNEVIAKRSSN